MTRLFFHIHKFAPGSLRVFSPDAHACPCKSHTGSCSHHREVVEVELQVVGAKTNHVILKHNESIVSCPRGKVTVNARTGGLGKTRFRFLSCAYHHGGEQFFFVAYYRLQGSQDPFLVRRSIPVLIRARTLQKNGKRRFKEVEVVEELPQTPSIESQDPSVEPQMIQEAPDLLNEVGQLKFARFTAKFASLLEQDLENMEKRYKMKAISLLKKRIPSLFEQTITNRNPEKQQRKETEGTCHFDMDTHISQFLSMDYCK